jgi:hypothetical protein
LTKQARIPAGVSSLDKNVLVVWIKAEGIGKVTDREVILLIVAALPGLAQEKGHALRIVLGKALPAKVRGTSSRLRALLPRRCLRAAQLLLTSLFYAPIPTRSLGRGY